MGEDNADYRFLKAYTRVEAFLRDAYGETSGEGVAQYLEQLRTSGMPTVRGSVYADLRRWRHLRNQIAHESAEGVCGWEDVAALEDFYIRLLHAEDPLTEAAGHQSRETAQPAANIPPPVLQQPSAAAPLQTDGIPPYETGAQSKSPRPMVRREKRQGTGQYAAWVLVFRLLAALGGALLLYAVGYFLTR